MSLGCIDKTVRPFPSLGCRGFYDSTPRIFHLALVETMADQIRPSNGLSIATFRQHDLNCRGTHVGTSNKSKNECVAHGLRRNGCGRLLSGDKGPAAVQLTRGDTLSGRQGIGLASTS
jgi:hypothetical protein